MGLFGPSKQEISWQRFAIEVGGTFHKHHPPWFHFFESESNKVIIYIKPWTITLDTYTTRGGYGFGAGVPMTFTRLSAPYISEDEFEFKIYEKGFLSELGKLFGMQDIEVGYPEIDHEFIIKANEQSKAQELFENAKIRRIIQLLLANSISLEARKPRDESQGLRYTEVNIVTDVERLKSILELLIETLNQMRKIGSASPLPLSE